MDEAARRQYCGLLMFDIPPQNLKRNNDVQCNNSLMIDCTTSLENSCIRAQDNFVFTSFMEPIRVRPQLPIRSNKSSSSPLSSSYSSKFSVDNNDKGQFIIDETELQMRPSLRKTPRPPNAFILYRREKQPEITAHYGNITNSKISKILAKMWRNEKDDIKMHWQRLADRKKMEHSQAHPGYVFSPKKSSNSQASASTAAVDKQTDNNKKEKKKKKLKINKVHVDKSTSTTTIVAKPITTAAATTATLTPAPAADSFTKSLLPQLSSSHDNNILNIIPSTGDADDPGYINTSDNINNHHRIIPHIPCINNSYFIADNNNYEPSISSPLSPLTPLTPLTPLPTPILSTPVSPFDFYNLSFNINIYNNDNIDDSNVSINNNNNGDNYDCPYNYSIYNNNNNGNNNHIQLPLHFPHELIININNHSNSNCESNCYDYNNNVNNNNDNYNDNNSCNYHYDSSIITSHNW